MGYINSEFAPFFISMHLPNYSGGTCKLINYPEIQYNLDDFDNESISFPSSLKIELHYNQNILQYLDKNVNIAFYDNNELIFHGYLDINSIYFDPNLYIYKLTFLDIFISLKYLKYNQIPYDNYLYEDKILFNDIITAIIKTVNLNAIVDLQIQPYYIKAKTFYNYLGNAYEVGFARMLTFPNYYFCSEYENAAVIINSFLTSLGLLGYFKGNKLIIKERFPNSFRTIQNYRVNDITIISRYDYYKANVRTSSGRQNYIYDFRMNPSIEPLKPIENKYELCGGTEPEGSLMWTNYYGLIPPYVSGLGYETVDNIQHNSFYNNYYPFYAAPWYINSYLTANRLCCDRLKIKATIFEPIEIFDAISINYRNYLVTNIKKKASQNKYEITAISV